MKKTVPLIVDKKVITVADAIGFHAREDLELSLRIVIVSDYEFTKSLVDDLSTRLTLQANNELLDIMNRGIK